MSALEENRPLSEQMYEIPLATLHQWDLLPTGDRRKALAVRELCRRERLMNYDEGPGALSEEGRKQRDQDETEYIRERQHLGQLKCEPEDGHMNPVCPTAPPTEERSDAGGPPVPVQREFNMKDSGERQEFSTGAVRDRQIGKGRYDLISPIAIKRIADILEKGAVKYSDRNWEKGMPLSRFIDSAKRHLEQFIEGWRDEDHLGQALWNLHSAVHTEEMIHRGLLPDELDDLPCYLAEDDPRRQP